MNKILLTLTILTLGLFGNVSLSGETLNFLDEPGTGLINSSNTNVSQNAIELRQNYPNPFSGRTNIIINATNEQKIEFKVYDMLGNVVIQKFMDIDKGQNTIFIDRDKLSQGLYFYSVDNGYQVLTKRMTIRD